MNALSLLPVWDNYAMAYRHRERILDPHLYDRVYDRAGNATSVILHCGRVAGLWQVEEKSRDRLTVTAAFFETAPEAA